MAFGVSRKPRAGLRAGVGEAARRAQALSHAGQRRRSRSPGLAAVGFLGGLAAGVLLASQQLHRHRRNLFSPRPYERLMALGYLRGQPSVETLRLLHDYVGWESRPRLRLRGLQLLRRLERTLD